MSTPTNKQTFPLMKEAEVLISLRDLEVASPFLPNSSETVPEQVRQIFSVFSVEGCDMPLVQDVIQQHQDTVNSCLRVSHPDSQSLSTPIIMLFIQLQQIFEACKVNNFTLQDVMKPSKKRFIFLYSALVNFKKFQCWLEDDLNQRNEKYADSLQGLKLIREELQEAKAQQTALSQNQQKNKTQITDINQKITVQTSQMKQKLRDMQQIVQQQSIKLGENMKLEREFQQLQRQIQQCNSQVEQLQRKIISPDALSQLKHQIEQLKADNGEYEQQIASLQKQAQQQDIQLKSALVLDQIAQQCASTNEKLQTDTSQYMNIQQSTSQLKETVAELNNEKREVDTLIAEGKQQMAENERKMQEMLKFKNSDEVVQERTKSRTQIALIQQKLQQQDDDLEIQHSKHEEITNQRVKLKKDVAVKQEKLVDSINALMKAFYVQQQEMLKIIQK